MKQEIAHREYRELPAANTYASAVAQLQKAASEFYKGKSEILHPTFVKDNGSIIFRPLTFKEDLVAIVEDFETLRNPDGSKRSTAERLTLFNNYKDSCTGIKYKKNSTKFKIEPVCKDLITIPPGFNRPFIGIDYESASGIELDSSKGKYSQLLTKKQVLELPAWKEAAEGDTEILKTYTNIVFKALKQDEAMGFWPLQNTQEDQLRALYVFNLVGSSGAGGNYDLDDDARLLLVQPKAP